MVQEDYELQSGGSGGGGSGMTEGGDNLQSCNATYQITGNQVVLMSRKALPTGLPKNPAQTASSITLLAAGGLPTYDDDGEIDIRGVKRVRITAGGFAIPMIAPRTNTAGTDGVDILVASDQSINLSRGYFPNQQTVQMTTDGVTINGGMGKVTLTTGLPIIGAPTIVLDATSITMSAGMSQIVIGPTGITITGLPMVNINPMVPPEPLPPLPQGELWA